jgi:16S rRNA (cytosine967-C5)-methyltransferase
MTFGAQASDKVVKSTVYRAAIYNSPMNASVVPLSQTLMMAARCLADVESGRALTEALSERASTNRSAVQAISTYAMRHWGLATAWRKHVLRKPPADAPLNSLVALSLLLLDAAMAHADPMAHPASPDTPLYAPHTVVDQSVQAARVLSSGKGRAGLGGAGLINAVLRRFQRERDDFMVVTKSNPVAQWNCPAWWLNRLRQAYPNHWQSMLKASATRAELVLRINPRRTTREAVVDAFEAQGWGVTRLSETALAVQTVGQIERLPGYHEGWWSVQDWGAQQAVPLLPLRDGQRVLDACAAPGGKTAHILERAKVDLTALDQDAQRLARVGDNLRRLGLMSKQVHLACADVRALDQWWNGQAFDAILADVPCSASGVLRRHPDIAWLRRESDLVKTVALQRQILDTLWTTLASGGHLLLVTCSVFPEEGEQQAVQMVQRHHDAIRLDALGQTLPRACGTDGLPGQDGFFYALFQKI